MGARLPVHDVSASTANLARLILQGLDRSKLDTSVPTATLALLLESLVGVMTPNVPARVEAQQRTVRDLVAQVTTAERERDEDRWQERGGDPPPQTPRRAWG